MENVEKIKPTGLFTNYIYKAIPLAFDESMSYYETLCGLLSYLKDTVIPAVNNNADAVIELQNLYNELHDYVEHYFDNLDVQDEINNKLDDMVKSGELDQVIEQYLNSSAIWGFDTIADMKNATNLIDGSYAKTLGYKTKNDGGSALYKIRKITNDDVVDEKLIIEMLNDNTLIAELITNGNKVNVLSIGGGITNNMTSCINYLIDKEYDVYIPRGNYTITSTIEINKNNTKLICDGNLTLNSSIIMFEITSNYNLIKLNGTFTGFGDNSTLLKIGSQNNNVLYNNIYIHRALTFNKGIDLYANNAHGTTYNYITFTFISSIYGIYAETGSIGANWIAENIFTGGVLNCQYGIMFKKGTNQTDPYNDNKFNQICFAGGNINCAIYLECTRFNYFNQLRMSEGLTGNYWIYEDNESGGNEYSNEYQIPLNKISLNSTRPNDFTRITANSITDSQTYYLGNTLINNNGSIFIPECVNTQRLLLNAYNTQTFDTLPEAYANGMCVRIGTDDANANYTYTLPSAFGKKLVKDFFILIAYKLNTTAITIKDSENNIIMNLPTGSAISRGLYRITYLGLDYYAKRVWAVSQMLPQYTS